MGVADEVFAGAGVARQDDPPVAGLEAVAEGPVERIVRDVERRDPDPVDLQRRTLDQFVDPDIRHFPAHRADLHPQFEIGPQQFEELPDHRADAFRPVDMPGPVVAENPAADDEMA